MSLAKSVWALALIGAAAPAMAQFVNPFDGARAARNYQAISQGRISLGDLSPIEQEEIRMIQRERLNLPRKSESERCRDQQRYAGAAPTDLERAATDLKCGKLGR